MVTVVVLKAFADALRISFVEWEVSSSSWGARMEFWWTGCIFA
jgi:hypothetical protein